jgi:adenosylcobinamide-phosphate synthase
MWDALVLVIALALDWALGELPTRYHPVGWTGRLIAAVYRVAPGGGSRRQFFFGLSVMTIVTGLLTALVWLVMGYTRAAGPWVYVPAAAFVFKQTFSWRGLKSAALAVRRPLAQNDLASARHNVRALVGRQADRLNTSQLVSATVESVAENSCDSFIAPLFYYLLFGVPGAVAYRIVNTFDSMVGRHGEFEYLGKAAARLDDAANFVPARISGFLLGLAALVCRRDAGGGWRVMLRDHHRTASPNAGWTMSALAGALDVRLEKDGCYQLGDAGRPLSVGTIDASISLFLAQSALWAGLCLGLEVARAYITQALAG